MRQTLPGDLRRRTEAKIRERVGFGLALAVVVALGLAVEWLGGNEAKASTRKEPVPSGTERPEGVRAMPEDSASRDR